MAEEYLFCPCPAQDCDGPRNARYWYHANGCGGKTALRYSNIMIRCTECNHRAILFDWQFKCSAHDYKPASKQGVLYALSIMGLHKGNANSIREATQEMLRLWPKQS